jgi:hypothetical protein
MGNVYWNGTSWSALTVPGLTAMTSVWGTGDDDVWIVGFGDAAMSVIAHFDGTNWTTTEFAGARLTGIGGFDRESVWAVGSVIMRLDRALTAPATCEQIGAACTTLAACAPGTGHVTDHYCAGAGQVCCTIPTNCFGPFEPTCCGPDFKVEPTVRPECRYGVFMCPGPPGAQPCPPPV